MKGWYYNIEAEFLDYDGKTFGIAETIQQVENFKGTRRITSLPAYPLSYHPESIKLKEQLIARGKKFVSLDGMQYKFQDGMAYYKVRKGWPAEIPITHLLNRKIIKSSKFM